MSSDRPRRAMIAITSYEGVFYPDGRRTGLFVSEALHPFLAFLEVGFEIDLVSETGTFGFDEHSLEKPYLTEEEGAMLRDSRHPFHQKLFHELKRASDVKAEEYRLFFASAGHASLFDYPHAHGLQSIASDIWARGGVVAAVCHGPALLPGVLDPGTGRSIIHGKRVTGFTTAGEVALNLFERICKADLLTIEDGAASAGAIYVPPPTPFEDFSLADGRVVTGANPASAYSTAYKAIEAYEQFAPA